MPVLLIGYTLSYGQFLSAAILMGIARYQQYSMSFLFEALLTLAGVAFLLPKYGLMGVAVAIATGYTVNRCLNLSWIFQREFPVSWAGLMTSIYLRPLALAAVSIVGLSAMRASVLPGDNWFELIAAGTVNLAFLSAGGWAIVLEPEHRGLAIAEVKRRLPGAVQAA
jgi:O-antigen/teichoic acid export membrane protein